MLTIPRWPRAERIRGGAEDPAPIPRAAVPIHLRRTSSDQRRDDGDPQKEPGAIHLLRTSFVGGATDCVPGLEQPSDLT